MKENAGERNVMFGHGVISVLIADDHPLVRTGIRNMLNRAKGIEVIGEAGDGEEALELATKIHPDVVILDMEMPKMNGIQVARRLQQRKERPIILALSAHEDKHFIMGMLESGAAGYLIKDEVPEAMIRAVQGIASGEMGWVSRRVAARIALWMHMENPDEMEFSEKDILLLRYYLSGAKMDVISSHTGIQEGEIEKQLDMLTGKVRSRFQGRKKGQTS